MGMYLDFGKIRIDDKSRTMEHELIHQQQDQRSKGKFFKNKKGMITDDEFIELVSKKRIIAIDTACKIESQDPELPNLEFRKCGIQFNADLYLFTDVIEHVENDLLFIKSYSDHAKNVSYFVL